jgi:hypothetical protein
MAGIFSTFAGDFVIEKKGKETQSVYVGSKAQNIRVESTSGDYLV